MIAIPLGKIAVPTPGTPVAITLIPAQTALVPAPSALPRPAKRPSPRLGFRRRRSSANR